MSECSAGATVNTCKTVFNKNFILSINKINSIKSFTMNVFHKLKIQIFMDVTHTTLLECEGTGSTFPKMSVFTSHHSISSHNTSIFIYTPVTTQQQLHHYTVSSCKYDPPENYSKTT